MQVWKEKVKVRPDEFVGEEEGKARQGKSKREKKRGKEVKRGKERKREDMDTGTSAAPDSH